MKHRLFLLILPGFLLGFAFAAGAEAPPAPPAEQIDYSIGDLTAEEFGKLTGRHLFAFDDAEFPETPGRISFDGNAVSFDGFTRKNQPEYFMSPPYSLVAVGKENQQTAFIEFEKPVEAVGFVLQFKTGTVKINFLDANGDLIQRIEQNGKGDPSGNGTWADYFVCCRSKRQVRVKRIEFTRLNLQDKALAAFSIDDLAVIQGAEQKALTPPKAVTTDFSFLGGANAADIAPQRPAGNPAVSVSGGTVELTNQVDGTRYAYRMDLNAGPSSLSGAVNGSGIIGIGKKWSFSLENAGVEWKFRSVDKKKDHVAVSYEWSNGSRRLPVTLTLSLSGGSLRMEFASAEGRPLKIGIPELDSAEKYVDPNNSDKRSLPFLGFAAEVGYLPGSELFYSYCADWKKSNSSILFPAIEYHSVAGKTAPLRETIVFTLSDALPKVLPSIPNPVSPYRKQIASSVVMEFWYGHFSELGEVLETCRNYGVKDLIVLVHRWQNAGFDRKYPTIMPPQAARGGLETLRMAIAEAVRGGQIVALHENYKDFYPDSPEWNPDDLLITRDGSPQKAWANAREMAPSKYLKYAGPMMERIRRELGSNGCFLDVHSTHLPWWRVDYRPSSPGAGMQRSALEFNDLLWRTARRIYQGPVFGEGYEPGSWIHTGNIDSVMAQSKYNSSLILDFLLLKIRPLATNHGAGYFERWNPRGYVGDWQSCPLPAKEYARYSLHEVAYLTAPTIDDKIKREIVPLAVAYYQKRKLLRLLSERQVVGITYFTEDGRKLTSSEALFLPKREVQRLREEFDDGSRIFLNFSDAPWRVSDSLTVEPLGFRAEGPGFEVETNRVNGLYFDYYAGKDGYFLNSRNFDWLLEPKGTAAMGRGQEGSDPILCNAGNSVVERGPIATDHAVSLEREPDTGWRMRFFPQRQAGFVTIDLEKAGIPAGRVVALNVDGSELPETLDAVERSESRLTIRRRDPGVWSYRIEESK